MRWDRNHQSQPAPFDGFALRRHLRRRSFDRLSGRPTCRLRVPLKPLSSARISYQEQRERTKVTRTQLGRSVGLLLTRASLMKDLALPGARTTAPRWWLRRHRINLATQIGAYLHRKGRLVAKLACPWGQDSPQVKWSPVS